MFDDRIDISYMTTLYYIYKCEAVQQYTSQSVSWFDGVPCTVSKTHHTFHKYLGYWSKNSVPSCCQISFWRFHLIVVNGLVHLAHRCRQVQSRSNGFSRFCWRGFWRQGGIIKRWRCCRWTIIEWRLQNKYKQMNHEDYQHIGTVWYSSVGQGYGDYFLQ